MATVHLEESAPEAGTRSDRSPVSWPAVVDNAPPEVALADESPTLPGAHRGGFQRLPTAPIGVMTHYAPVEPGTADEPQPELRWLMPEPVAPHRGLAAWALGFSIVGLMASLFVGWGFPLGLVGCVAAMLALRRPTESRGVAIWALVLGIVSIVYSAGWLLYAADRANLFA